MQDKIFKALLIISAIIIPVIGVGIVFSLVNDASGAFEHFGFWNFIFSDDWVTTAGKEKYGALPFITGTLLTTLLALLMCINSNHIEYRSRFACRYPVYHIWSMGILCPS